MIVNPTLIEDCFIIQPKIFEDERGYFYESFNQNEFSQRTGIQNNFVQDNVSKSAKGVLRGLHFQEGENAQAKLVRVIKGRVQDVVVDLRPNSRTFGNHFSIELSEENKRQLFIPRGFAHGFLVLENDTIFSYKCDNYYNKKSERGIIYNDSKLDIKWKQINKDYKLSEKDLNLPKFKDLVL
ncbi:MAG: dTDP-4-dehydrorhamnose 3,5-epimerase [Winogradskyella sp.]|uniref:dTDP-4-dehydrorhamnose 3,5-epimerase n=1 Tax=Winogradskyella sp. TaxID=1883156 RepID=UPI00179E79C3|nr:dTDP-4-dehydrorhamnose 3,5-epimerase [Winogradskyella sp.]MBT8245444.1 dTDP-4-dehydrorhamnose 3,5-epimerase [Winogradskyella sp.]NNK22787.1 dTDP-4-dehydrorhamnose 3,5-epimerase [Winogradskyella sp.]